MAGTRIKLFDQQAPAAVAAPLIPIDQAVNVGLDPEIKDINPSDTFHIQCCVEYEKYLFKGIKELEIKVKSNETFADVAKRCREISLNHPLYKGEIFPEDSPYSIRSPTLGDLDISDCIASYNKDAESVHSYRNSDFWMLIIKFYPKPELVHERSRLSL